MSDGFYMFLLPEKVRKKPWLQQRTFVKTLREAKDGANFPKSSENDCKNLKKNIWCKKGTFQYYKSAIKILYGIIKVNMYSKNWSVSVDV